MFYEENFMLEAFWVLIKAPIALSGMILIITLTPLWGIYIIMYYILTLVFLTPFYLLFCALRSDKKTWSDHVETIRLSNFWHGLIFPLTGFHNLYVWMMGKG